MGRAANSVVAALSLFALSRRSEESPSRGGIFGLIVGVHCTNPNYGAIYPTLAMKIPLLLLRCQQFAQVLVNIAAPSDVKDVKRVLFVNDAVVSYAAGAKTGEIELQRVPKQRIAL